MADEPTSGERAIGAGRPLASKTSKLMIAVRGGHGLAPASALPDIAVMTNENAAWAASGWLRKNFQQSSAVEWRDRWGEFEADQILDAAFAGALRHDALDMVVERDGKYLWSPKPTRELPTEKLYAEMHGEIRELKERLARVEQTLPNLGHNNPPEPIDTPPLDQQDRKELGAALDVLASQPVEPPTKMAAQEAASVVETKGQKVRKWLTTKRDAAVAAAVNAAVGEGVKALFKNWDDIARAIDALLDKALKWIASLV